MIDYYKILNINSDASLDDIKKAYRILAKKYHPDNYNGSEQEASEHMSIINEAYNILTNEKKKALYDMECSEKETAKTDTGNAYTATKPPPPREKTEPFRTPPPPEPDLTEKTSAKKQTTRQSSGCFGKIIEYIVYLAIISFLINHFDLPAKIKPFIEKAEHVLNTDKTNFDKSPENCVDSYFESLKGNNIEEVTSHFEDTSYSEYNKIIYNIFHSIDKDDMYYHLFKEILEFDISFDNADYNADKTKATVSVTVQNINCFAVILDLIAESDSRNADNLIQEEINSMIDRKIKNKENYMTACKCTFTLGYNNSIWKICDIDDIQELSSILVGNIDKLSEITMED